MALLLFKNIRELMLIDRICHEKNLDVKVMPIPHQYSTECGMTLVVKDEDIPQIETILSNKSIVVDLKSDAHEGSINGESSHRSTIP